MLKRRGILIHPDELTENWLRRLEGSGINTLGLHPVGGVDAHNSLGALLRQMETPEFQAMRRRVNDLGVELEFEMHAMSYLMPRDLFAEHPDWFRMNDKGERVNDFNFCCSNPEAIAYLQESVRPLARFLAPQTHRHFYWADDVHGGACCCEKCRHMTESDQQMTFVNAMLTGIRKDDPEATMPFLAYNECMELPKVKPVDGVFLEYAPIKRDMDAPLCDTANEKNRSETLHLPELVANFDMENAQVLDYWMDNSLLSGWKKPPKPFYLREEVMRKDVEFYTDLGFGCITCFGCYLGDDYMELHGEPPFAAYAEILRNAK